MNSLKTVARRSAWSSARGPFSWTTSPSKLRSGTQQAWSATGPSPQRGYTHTIIHAHKAVRSITASTSHFTIIIMTALSLLVDSGITGERLEHCWSMTLASTWPMRAQSGGWRSSTTTQTLTLWSCWWETRATWSPSGPCPQGRPETLQVRAVML